MYRAGDWTSPSLRVGASCRSAGFAASLDELLDKLKSNALDRGLTVTIHVASVDAFPERYAGMILRVADELLSNAIEHGFYKRQRGRVLLRITRHADRIHVVAQDDGWGFGPVKAVEGNGFRLLRQMGELTVSDGEHLFNAYVGVAVLLGLCGPKAAACDTGR